MSRDLYQLVLRDLDDCKDWRDRQPELEKLRLAKRKPRRQPYPGAPQLVEPLVDDNVTALTSAENSILWSTSDLAVFLPLYPEGYQLKRVAERGFDSMLRLTLNVRAKLENLFDTKNERGMGIPKMVPNDTALPGSTLPDFIPVSPLDVIVPSGTRQLRDADRVTHVIRYTEREFKMEAQKRGWQNTDAVLQTIHDAPHEDGTNDGEYGVSRSRVQGDDRENSEAEVVVWEVYAWQEKDGVFRKHRTTLCPDLPDKPLQTIDWRWDDKVVPLADGDMMVIEGEDRPWPFVQMRYENRSLAYYDTRSVGDKLESDQKEATAFKMAQALMFDYTAKPFLKGPPGSTKSFRWRPGDTLPPDVELEIPPRVDPIFEYNLDRTRAIGARRVGTPQGALSSADQKQDRKTATEVSQTAMVHNMLSVDAVERFAEPLGELFAMMWEYMRHNPPQNLPAVSGNNVAIVPPEAFSVPFLIIPGISGKSANPELLLRQMMTLGQMMGAFPQAQQFVRGDEMAKVLFDQIDPRLTPHLVVDPQQGTATAPLEQRVEQMAAALAEIIPQVQANGQYLAAIAQQEDAEAKLPKQGGGQGER